MRRSATGSRKLRPLRAAAVTATTLIVASVALSGSPAYAINPPGIDPAAVPPDSPPGPTQPMKQTAYCTDVGVLPGTDFRVQPKYMDMLNLPEAWRFGRGAGVRIAVIDTGVTPHPRLPHLVPGGDYVMGGGDGLHGVGSRMCDLLRMDRGWDELGLAQQDLPAGCGHGPDRVAGMSGTRATGVTRATCAARRASRL